jgi:hypothetical protein
MIGNLGIKGLIYIIIGDCNEFIINFFLLKCVDKFIYFSEKLITLAAAFTALIRRAIPLQSSPSNETTATQNCVHIDVD